MFPEPTIVSAFAPSDTAARSVSDCAAVATEKVAEDPSWIGLLNPSVPAGAALVILSPPAPTVMTCVPLIE